MSQALGENLLLSVCPHSSGINAGGITDCLTGEGKAGLGKRGTTVTIEAMFLLLSLPNLASAAVLECSRGVGVCLYANANV